MYSCNISSWNFLFCCSYLKVGRFRVDETDYFIEPDVDLEAIKQSPRNFLTKNQDFSKTEISYVLIDDQICTLQTHAIYKHIHPDKKKSSPLNTTTLVDTCLLIGRFS